MISLVHYRRKNHENIFAGIDYEYRVLVIRTMNGQEERNTTFGRNTDQEFADFVDQFALECSLRGFVLVSQRWEKE